ncbi:hypothetical protein FNV43_RR06588 [Rhamnella rubrinervis]|uniref:25S rRNA (uridine-N(3))-methyltransferase BMT5-like domain-containing protein n=1 Tax=Rhamnella rubrinervis TaxID=2594499 RepID=A0A8K0HE40_9ROSA|nr:hypothetical protein FNV43_RR06588 [Rhamnella rubrinervis]
MPSRKAESEEDIGPGPGLSSVWIKHNTGVLPSRKAESEEDIGPGPGPKFVFQMKGYFDSLVSKHSNGFSRYLYGLRTLVYGDFDLSYSMAISKHFATKLGSDKPHSGLFVALPSTKNLFDVFGGSARENWKTLGAHGCNICEGLHEARHLNQVLIDKLLGKPVNIAVFNFSFFDFNIDVKASSIFKNAKNILTADGVCECNVKVEPHNILALKDIAAENGFFLFKKEPMYLHNYVGYKPRISYGLDDFNPDGSETLYFMKEDIREEVEKHYEEMLELYSGAHFKKFYSELRGRRTNRGMPDSWLDAMKNDDLISKKITLQDEGALKYLKEIKCCAIDNSEGFELYFFFYPNPYFSNSVLTKTHYVMDKAIGTEIQWFPGKSLTQKLPKRESKNAKPIPDCYSFFNFFNPPQLSEDNGDMEEVEYEELLDAMAEDYEIGLALKNGCGAWGLCI